MAMYIYTEENGQGLLKKKVQQEGQPDKWETDLRTPLPEDKVVLTEVYNTATGVKSYKTKGIKLLSEKIGD